MAKMSEKWRVIRRNRKRFPPVAEVSAGRMAELHVAALLEERLRGTAYDYVAGVRVPGKKRRHEIDFVITTRDEIWVVELKNWSGFVGIDGGRVVQHRSGGRGVVDHGRLLATVKRKGRTLETYLRRCVDSVPAVWPVLVFYNAKVALSEELFGDEKLDIVKLPEFLSALPESKPDYGPIWSRIRKLFGAADDEPKQLPAVTDQILEARRALAELGTWDLMAMYGGRLASGDIVSISAPQLDDRDSIKRLYVDAPRSVFDLFGDDLKLRVRAEKRTGAQEEFELGFDETVQFHRAGQPKPETFSLRHVVGLSFGYA